MNSYQIAKQLRDFLGFAEENYLVSSLATISEMSRKVLHECKQMPMPASNAAKFLDFSNALNGEVTALSTALKAKVTTKQLFVASDEMQKRLASLREQFAPGSAEQLQTIESRIVDFDNAFGDYIHDQGPNNALAMMEAAKIAHESFATFRDTSSMILAQLQHEPPTSEESGELSLCLGGDSDFKTFVAKLTALEELYVELCTFFKVSEAQHPLTIIKIESGSLYTSLAGAKDVMAMICRLIENTATWFYRNYTTEGKIQGVALQMDAIKKGVDLKAALEDGGIATSNLGARLEKASEGSARQLATLICGEPSIEINGATYEMPPALRQQFLEQSSRTLRIEDQRENDSDSQGGGA